MPSVEHSNPPWTADFDTIRREKLFRAPSAETTPFPALAEAFAPHTGSFDAVFEANGLLDLAIKDIGTKTFFDGGTLQDSSQPRNKVSIRIVKCFFQKPEIPPSNKISTSNRRIYPAECRERHSTYKGKFSVRLGVRINDDEWSEVVRDLGGLPIMLRTNKCHLQSLSPAQLVQRKEESEEFGGYFIVNGNEKLIRMLVVPKRNYPMAIIRSSNKNRGPTYTEFGVQLRSVRPDQTSQTCTLHYLNDGNVVFRFSWRKSEYLVPVMMIFKALVETNDREIFQNLINLADEITLKKRQFAIDRVEMLLRTYKVYNIHGRAKSRAHLGSKFRPVLGVPDDATDEDVGSELLRKVVLPHLGSYQVTEDNDADKFAMLLFMTKKLYALVEGDCAMDNPDAISNQEILLGGFLYGMTLKERLEEWLGQIRLQCDQWHRLSHKGFDHSDFSRDFVPKILAKTNENIGALLEYFLSTGNLVSPSGLDLQQTNGYTIVAEKLNFYRFLSHFRCVHRGSFFATLKTTTVRKLLPESWGFLCPVHTPDGAPCGLLNHLAHECKVATRSCDTSVIPDLVAKMGVTSNNSALAENAATVQLDGRILGSCSPSQARDMARVLRRCKVEGRHGVPRELEIGHVPTSNRGQYPGIYMFSHAARMYRPVKHLPTDQLDFIGPFEQPYMSIACDGSDIHPSDTTHIEYDPTNMLSILANMTPFSDFNQSPRNMYQCQMSKQTMGTPGSSLHYRTDNRLYRLQSGQTPIARPPLHSAYGLDNFPNGTNAVVAVISYTGYDMDDAMILNRSAHDRGFAHGSIYKTKKIELEDDARRRSRSIKTASRVFGFAPGGMVRSQWQAALDEDGLPFVGREINEGDALAASHTVVYNAATQALENQDTRTELHRYKDMETAFVDSVRLHGADDGASPPHSASITLRVPRAPVIGDKFSSRHGQKGVCSQKFPAADMPFSESGIVPDVLINPHAFPSRMTIGMFVESLAGKSGALHGLAQDSTPFRFRDEPSRTATAFFGDQLRAAGYNYHGNEPMYSGITGAELAADIYVGVVYYQRLRHMVNDKFQVRTTGPVNPSTGQPVKGRSRGGGIRVGEMERDALIAHGTSFLLQDRLLNCSDYSRCWVCRRCGFFLGVVPSVAGYGGGRGSALVRCRRCARRVGGMGRDVAGGGDGEAWADIRRETETWQDGDGTRFAGGDDTTVVAVPGVLRYLDAEMAAMGIGMRFRVGP